jgi:hypothetical protein
MKPAHGPENSEKARRAPAGYARYSLLLPLILLSLVVSGVEDQYPLLKRFSHWRGVTVLVLTLYVSGVGRAFLLSMACLALAAALAWNPVQGPPESIGIAAVAFFGVLIAAAPFAILRKVWRDFAVEGVDAEVVLGALCAYLYIGAWYAYLYRAMSILSNAPFFAQPGSEDGLNYMYFSFITLTTVGYGDLFPASGAGRMLAATEAIVGQLYLVSVVALVVSAYGRRRGPRP